MGENIPGGNFPEGEFSRGSLMGGNFPVGNFPITFHMFLEIGVLKSFAIFTGNAIFAWRPAILLKRHSNTGAFPENIARL